VRRDSHRDRHPEPRAVKATGRVADSAVSQAARDVHERRAVTSAQALSEFAEIRTHLEAARLLAELSHSHGVRPEKYHVVKGRDGSDRIRCGARHLNVSDFLTKELYLPWDTAAQMLRQVWRRQLDRMPTPPVKELPRAVLWREYTVVRDANRQVRREAWERQRASESVRRESIKRTFLDARAAARGNTDLRPSGRRAAISLARMAKVTGETALRETIRIERDSLKTRYGDAAGQSFAGWLQERAQGGDERALAELRRVRSVLGEKPEIPDLTENHIRPVPNAASAAGPAQANQILFRQPAPGYTLSYEVHRNGDVTYRHDGRDVVRDRVTSVQVLARERAIDRDALEAGLRLAQAKFGSSLELAGPESFRREAAQVAADAGIYVQFTDESLNLLMQARRAELITQRADRVLSRDAVPVSLPALPTIPPQPAPASPTPANSAAAPDVDPDPAARQPKGPSR
jgi:Large polyvalent protein-associated domain 7